MSILDLFRRHRPIPAELMPVETSPPRTRCQLSAEPPPFTCKRADRACSYRPGYCAGRNKCIDVDTFAAREFIVALTKEQQLRLARLVRHGYAGNPAYA